MVESRIPLNFEKALDKSFREFLFGNSHVGSVSQGLKLQVLYMELGTPHETQPNLFY